MSIVELLKEAIKTRKSISFEYRKESNVREVRYGNVYAVYYLADELSEILVDIVQTAGESDSKNEMPFPSFRSFSLDRISDVTIFFTKSSYLSTHPKYNPLSDRYKNAIAKV